MNNKYVMKLSGESFIGESNLDFNKALDIAKQILKISQQNKIAVVCGAGNIIRGRDYHNKNYADYMGMMATNINIMLLYSAISSLTDKVKVYSLVDNKFCDF